MFLMTDLGWDASTKSKILYYHPKSMIILRHMGFRVDSFLKCISWFNESVSSFTFYVLEGCVYDGGPRQYTVIDKFSIKCNRVNATQKLYFPKPFFVKKDTHLGVLFTDNAAAFGYDKKITAEYARVSREISNSVKVLGKVTEDANDVSLRNYHLQIEYCPMEAKLKQSHRKQLLKANKEDCLSKYMCFIAVIICC